MMEEQLQHIVQSALMDFPQLFIVDIAIKGAGKHTKVIVTLDGDKGVGIDDCALVSQRVHLALDETLLLGEFFTLEVTSPGVDEPLKWIRQYPKHIGRKLRVILENLEIIEGKLIDFTPEILTVEVQTGKGKKSEIQQKIVNFNQIKKSVVLVSFK